jgi:hypothetical protein
MDWIFWTLVGAAVVHVAEEHFGGFLEFTRHIADRFTRVKFSLTMAQFVVVNAAFIGLTIAAALLWPRHPAFCLSIPALLLINTCLHLVPMLATRRYSPGSISALLLYVPLSIYAFHVADTAGLGSTVNVISAFALGLFWMILPVGTSIIIRAASGGPDE